MIDVIKVRFKDMDYVLIGSLDKGGAIALESDYQNFSPSFAHLMPDGKILRYQQWIGNREDLEVLSDGKMIQKLLDLKCLDSDLKAIKADFERGFMDLGTNKELMLALLRRLDAAEKCARWLNQITASYPEETEPFKDYVAWCKSRGVPE